MTSMIAIAVAQRRWDTDIAHNVEDCVNSLAECAARGAEIVLFPEANLTSYDFEYAQSLSAETVANALTKVSESCRKHSISAVVGTLGEPDSSRKMLNIAHVFNAYGELIHKHSKIFLAGGIESDFCRPGSKLSLFTLGDMKASVIICRDGRHIELALLATMAGANVILHPSTSSDTLEKSWWKQNSGRATHSIAPHLAVFHVVSNSIGQNRSGSQICLGESVIYDPTGLEISKADMFNESTLFGRLDLDRASARFTTVSKRHPAALQDSWRNILKIAFDDDQQD